MPTQSSINNCATVAFSLFHFFTFSTLFRVVFALLLYFKDNFFTYPPRWPQRFGTVPEKYLEEIFLDPKNIIRVSLPLEQHKMRMIPL